MKRNKRVQFKLQQETIKGCLKKTVYTNRFVAEIEAKRFDKRAYKCSYCNNFHLTSKKLDI